MGRHHAGKFYSSSKEFSPAKANETTCIQDKRMLGLPLHPDDFVMIGRIINQDWYEGYLPGDKTYGYIPRNYVKIESVYDPSFAETLGCNPQPLPLSAPAPVSARPPRRLRQFFWAAFVDPLASLFSWKHPKHKQIITALNTAPHTSAPLLPPSPFPPKPPVPNMDILENGSRLRLRLKLEPHNPDDYPTIKANLSLVSAPQTRISHVTVELQFEHDSIVELEPKREASSETEANHGNSVTNDISLTGGANHGPVGVNLKLGRTVSKTVEFTRHTRGTIVGDGEGSSIAYWVLKEDPGRAGRFGLDPQYTMWVKLHVRPVRVDYQVTAKILADDGEAGNNWFRTKRLGSGRQRFYFAP
ncbi:hypothetical protein JB92DRAFT_2027930 [Gautieria morchelliformis]|nr:hypothetical protein JB92DRAFT_2027930 [Gautieria morchelliformis]